MIYSDAENKRWWNTMTIADREELIVRISESATAPTVQEWIRRFAFKHPIGTEPTTVDLVKLRQWAK